MGQRLDGGALSSVSCGALWVTFQGCLLHELIFFSQVQLLDFLFPATKGTDRAQDEIRKSPMTDFITPMFELILIRR